jgi:phosphopantothenoylcysteine decarboxylase / phosphopantothenate---cysteine ligase
MFNNVLIASGPTIEPIDPVRFISNRSSGKTGYHLATEAHKRQISAITFVTGPTCHLPTGVRMVAVETAQEMRKNMLKLQPDAQVIIMAAAVCDFRSLKYYTEKIKKEKDRITLEFIRNPDILQELGSVKSPGQILVGFAAETENMFENAHRKMAAKNLDLLVLNEISEDNPAFGVDDNQAYFITRGGIRKLEKMSKAKLAGCLWDAIAALSPV